MFSVKRKPANGSGDVWGGDKQKRTKKKAYGTYMIAASGAPTGEAGEGRGT